MTDDVEEFLATRGAAPCKPGYAAGLPRRVSACCPSLVKASQYAPLYADRPRHSLEHVAVAKILSMTQALFGVVHSEGKEYKGYIKERARRWFFEDTRDLELWCETAGLDPAYVQERVKKRLEEGRLPEWRAAPGKGERYEERRAYRLKHEQRQPKKGR